MNVKSYWTENLSRVPRVGEPVHAVMPWGAAIAMGVIAEVEPDRALIRLNKPMPWQEPEQFGISFGQFHDTED